MRENGRHSGEPQGVALSKILNSKLVLKILLCNGNTFKDKGHLQCSQFGTLTDISYS